MENIMGVIFRICWTRLGRWGIQIVPDAIISAMFKMARTRWKAATHTTKRTGLGTIRFSFDKPGGDASSDLKRLNRDPLAAIYETE